MNIKRLSVNALLAAMCAVLGAVSLDFGNLKITFESLPVLIGALLFGPLDGLAVGGIGTLLYQLLRYGVTLTTPLWIAPYMLCGLWVGHCAKARNFELSIKQLTFAIFSSEIMILLINTFSLYVDSKIYGYYSPVFIFGSLFPRIILCLVKSAAFSAAMPALLRAARQATKGW